VKNKLKGVIIGAGAIAAVAAGGAAIAGAAGSGGGDNKGGDKAITGAALDKASAAALKSAGPGKVTGTEAGDEESHYQVEVTRPDGSQVDVQLDRGFNVVGSKADREDAQGSKHEQTGEHHDGDGSKADGGSEQPDGPGGDAAQKD
jgi:hypothetical protein